MKGEKIRIHQKLGFCTSGTQVLKFFGWDNKDSCYYSVCVYIIYIFLIRGYL